MSRPGKTGAAADMPATGRAPVLNWLLLLLALAALAVSGFLFTVDCSLTAPGRIVADMLAVLRAPAGGGRIAAIHIQDGALVDQDTLLLRFDSRSQEQALAAAREALRDAENELALTQLETAGMNLHNRRRLEELRDASARCRRQVELAEAQLGACELRTPVAGQARLLGCRPGMVVRPGTPLVEICGLEKQLLLEVPPAAVASLRPGQKYSARLTMKDGSATVLSGTVTKLAAPNTTGGSRKLFCSVAEEPENLLPGMAGEVRFHYGRESLWCRLWRN